MFMSIITITTDFGLRDGYVGVMKGVIWGINPDVRIVDITHLIPPQDINQGSIALGRVSSFFPEKTIHIAVIDPGVGIDRRPMAAKIGSLYYVGLDNGLITRVIKSGEEAGKELDFVELNIQEYWLSEISHVFHGRDIFAPVAAHLSNGVSLKKIGTSFMKPILIPLPEIVLLPKKIIGEVVAIDNFGNLATNIMQSHLDAYPKIFSIKIHDFLTSDFEKTFGDKPVGSLVGLIGTQNDLVIACVNANAREKINGFVGSPVEIVFE